MRSVGRSVFSSGLIIILLCISVVLGYATDMLITRVEKYIYPTDFSEQITACAENYDLDPHIVYAMVKELSNFSSNRISDDGRIGLMQLSEETFLWLTDEQLGEHLDPGLLYDPTTNIRYGCYYLLYLTTRYDSWETVFAAYLSDPILVDKWLTETPTEQEFVIPNEEISQKAIKIQRTVDKYKKLYQEKGDVVS